MASAPGGASRWDRLKSALTPAEWRRAAGLAAAVLGLHVVGFFLLLVLVVPKNLSLGEGGSSASASASRLHAGPAPRVRLLFAAGMSLLDTIYGAFMNFAYGWGLSKPVRKVYYNMTITGLSVAVALIVGTVELMSVLAEELGLSGRAWDFASNLDPGLVGYFIAGLFVATWGGRAGRVALRPDRGTLVRPPAAAVVRGPR